MDSLRDYAKVTGIQQSEQPVAQPAPSVFSRRGQILSRLSAGEAVDPNELQDVDNHAVSTSNTFMQGLRSSLYGGVAASQAFVGQMAEPVAPEFSKGMMKGAQDTLRNMPGALRPEYESFEQAADKGGAVGVISHGARRLGEAVPSAALMATTSGLGAGLGAATRLGARAGSVVGGVAGMTPLEGGETALELQNDPKAMANTTPAQRAALTLGRGAVNAALENVVPQALLVPAMLGKAAKAGAGQGIKGALKNTALLGAEGAAGEYGTEAAQELTGQAAMNVANPEAGFDLAKAHEAGLSGAVAGLVGGAGAGTVQALRPSAKDIKEPTPHLDGLQGAMNDVVKNYVKDPAKREAYADMVANIHANTESSVDFLKHALENESAGELGKALGAAYGNTKDIFRGAKDTITNLAAGMAEDAKIDPSKKSSYDSINKRTGFRAALAENNPQLAEMLDSFVGQAGDKKDQNVLWNAIIRASEDPEWNNKVFAPAVGESFTKHTGVDINEALGSIRSKNKEMSDKANAGIALTKFMHESKIPLDQRSSIQGLVDVGSLDALSPVQQAYLGSLADKTKTDVPTLYGSLMNLTQKGASSGITDKELQSSWDEEGLALSDPTKLSDETSFISGQDGDTMNEVQARSPFDHQTITESLADEKYLGRGDAHFPVKLSATDADGNPIAPSVLAKAFPVKRGGQLSARTNADDSNDSLEVNLSPKSLVAMSKSPNNRDRFKELAGEYSGERSVGENAADSYSGLLGGLESQGIDVDPAVLGLEGDTPIHINVSTDEKALKNDLIVAHNKDKTPYRLSDLSKTRKRSALTADDHARRQEIANSITSYEDLSNALKDQNAQINQAKQSGNGRQAVVAKQRARDLNGIKYAVDRIVETEKVTPAKALELYSERQNDVIRGKRQKSEFSAISSAVRSGDLSKEDTDAVVEYYKEVANATEDMDPVAVRGKEVLDELGITPVSHRIEEHISDLEDVLEKAHNNVVEAGSSSDSPDKVAREGITAEEQAQGEFEQYQKSDAAKLNAATSQRTGEPKPAPVYEEKAPLPNPQANPNPEIENSQRRFVDIVRKLAGDRIVIRFGRTMPDNAAAQFYTREQALEDIRQGRRKLIRRREEGENVDAEYNLLMKQEQKLLKDTAILGIIHVAAGREGMAGLAEHETFHGAFSFFFNPEERRALTTAFTRSPVLKKLKEYFKDQPEVLKAIDESPEEAAAYGFQVWMYDPSVLKVGPSTQGLFSKFSAWLNKLSGMLTPADRAELILLDFKSGRRADPNPTPLQVKLDRDKPWEDRAVSFAKDVGSLLNTAYDRMLGGTYDRLAATENVALEKIAKLGYNAVGEGGNRGGYVQSKSHQERMWLNKLGKIFDGLNEDQLYALNEALILDKPAGSQILRTKQKQINEFFREAFKYQKDVGVDIGYHPDSGNYYPLIFDPERVATQREEFISMLSQPKYATKMKALNKTAAEVFDGITSYIDKGTDLVNVMGEDNEPLAESSHKRTLGFLDKEDRLPYMDQNPLAITAKYVKQMVRQTEFVRSYGLNGKVLNDLKKEAATVYGATPDQLALVDDYVDGILGNKEIGMSRELKDIFGSMTVYQNFRLLPLSLFSSLVDPVGVAIRSGNITDAWDTFAYSMKNITKGLKDQNYTRDEFEQLAEDWGIIAHAGMMDNVANMYDNITLRGVAKKMNDALFKYNLLNGWIRNNTIMAVKAAHMFFYRSADPNSQHGARHLEELGLSPSDIMFDTADKRLLVRADELEAAGMSHEEAEATEEKLKNATDKFVRQALLSPNAAELPNWASNPYLMPIAHLKNFTFGFNAVINRRIMHELAHDNFKPALIATAYVPGMIAADFMKDLLSNAGDEPPYKKDWGAVDYIEHGIARSGLTGVGQFFIDAKEDIMRGGTGAEGFLGPSVNQFDKGIRALGSGDSDKIWNWVVKAGPFSVIYDQSLMSGGGE